MRYPLIALLIALTLSPSCGRSEDPVAPDPGLPAVGNGGVDTRGVPEAPVAPETGLPVVGTVGTHAKDLPDPKVVVHLLPDGGLSVDGRAVAPGDFPEVLRRSAPRPAFMYGREEGSENPAALVIRADRGIPWERVRKVISAPAAVKQAIVLVYFCVRHEGDGEEGTFVLRLPPPWGIGQGRRMPQGRFVRVARRFTEPASPASIVPALGDTEVAVSIDPHPSTSLEYVLQMLDALVRSGHEEVALGWGKDGAPGAPVGMRLDGRPVPMAAVALPAVTRSDGPAGIDLTVRDTYTRFADGRALDALTVTVLERGGRMETVARMVEGLATWAGAQGADGSWAMAGRSRIGATGIVIVGFLAAGRSHRRGEYRRVVRNGLRYLKQNQDKEGRYSTDAVDHAAATWAMAKAYTLTRSPLFRQSSQQAIDALSDEGGAWTVLARAEAVQAGLRTGGKAGDTAAALRKVLAGPIDETDPRGLLALASKWLFPPAD